MPKHSFNKIKEDDALIADLIHIVPLELEKGPAADEEDIRDAYKRISELMEIPVEEVEDTLETGIRDYDKIQRRNRWLWGIAIAAGVAVLVWRVWGLIR